MGNLYRGCDGDLEVDGNHVARVKTWQVNFTVDMDDVSDNDSCKKQYLPGMEDGTGSLTCNWVSDDVNGQDILKVSAIVEMKLYPQGTATGDRFFAFTAIVSDEGYSSETAGYFEKSISYQVSGDVERGTVA